MVTVTVTASAGGSSNDNKECSAGCKRRGGAEVTGVDGDNEDYGADGWVFVGGGHVAATATETAINYKQKQQRW